MELIRHPRPCGTSDNLGGIAGADAKLSSRFRNRKCSQVYLTVNRFQSGMAKRMDWRINYDRGRTGSNIPEPSGLASWIVEPSKIDIWRVADL